MVFTISFLMLSSSCKPDCGDLELCFTINSEHCPNADLNGSVIHLSERRQNWVYMNTTTGETQSFQDINHPYGKWEDRGGLKYSTNAVVDNSTAINRFVEGYEINYGFWS